MSQFDDKNSKTPEKKDHLSKIDLMHHLINKGIVCYLPENFNNDNFSGTVLDWMHKSLGLDALLTKSANIQVIEYRKKTGITGTLGITSGCRLFLLSINQKCILILSLINGSKILMVKALYLVWENF